MFVKALPIALLFLLPGCTFTCPDGIGTASWNDPSVPDIVRQVAEQGNADVQYRPPLGLRTLHDPGDKAPFQSALTAIHVDGTMAIYDATRFGKESGYFVISPREGADRDQLVEEASGIVASIWDVPEEDAKRMIMPALNNLTNQKGGYPGTTRPGSVLLSGPSADAIALLREGNPSWIFHYEWSNVNLFVGFGEYHGSLTLYGSGGALFQHVQPYDSDFRVKNDVRAAFEANGWPAPEFANYTSNPVLCL